MIKKLLFLILAALLIFLFFRLSSLGAFRTVENKFEGETVKRVHLRGCEDIQISYIDSFALVSSTKREVFPPVRDEIGNLHYVELKSGEFNVKELKSSINKPFSPHGISMVKVDDYYRVLAVNGKMGKHAIEEFKLVKDSLIYVKTWSDPSMIMPNDVLAIDAHSFYWTNDHKYTKGIGYFMEGFLALEVSTAYYYDGQNYNKAAGDIAFANGINIDRKRNLVYIASSTGLLLKVYSRSTDGSLEFIEDIPLGTGVDNITVDKDGILWLGCHPKLLKLNTYENDKNRKISPSELVKVTYNGINDYKVEEIYMDDGHMMSASTVAATFGKYILAGNFLDNKFLILKQN